MKDFTIKWLRRAEAVTKTDMVYLVGQSGWLILGQAAIFISSLLLAWVFANYVLPSDYGLYKYVLSIATLATLTSLTGFGISISRATVQGHDVALNKILKTRIKYGTLGAVALFSFAGYYLYRDNTLLASLFALTAIWIPFLDSLTDYQFLLQGKKDFKTQTYLKIFQRLFLSILLVSVILLSKNIVVITFSYFALLNISNYLIYIFTIKKYPVTDDANTPYENIDRYGKQVSLQNIFFIGAGQLDKILMFKFLGPSQLAIYFFAMAIPNEIQGVLGNINSVAFPKLVDKTSREFKFALIKKIFTFTSIMVIPAILYIFAAPYLFKWLFPVYIDAVFISQLYIGTVLFIPVGLLWHYFYATKNQKALWYGTFAGPGILILGILVFVPKFGLLGAVMATYIRAIVDLLSGLYFFFRKEKSTPPGGDVQSVVNSGAKRP